MVHWWWECRPDRTSRDRQRWYICCGIYAGTARSTGHASLWHSDHPHPPRGETFHSKPSSKGKNWNPAPVFRIGCPNRRYVPHCSHRCILPSPCRDEGGGKRTRPYWLQTSSPIIEHNTLPNLMSCSGRQGKRGPRPRRRYPPQRRQVRHPQPPPPPQSRGSVGPTVFSIDEVFIVDDASDGPSTPEIFSSSSSWVSTPTRRTRRPLDIGERQDAKVPHPSATLTSARRPRVRKVPQCPETRPERNTVSACRGHTPKHAQLLGESGGAHLQPGGRRPRGTSRRDKDAQVA